MSTYERHVLDNGLRVLTANLPEAQSVTCMVMLAAGSRYETPDTNGIAHFSEHMFFKGTERRPSAREIAGEIDAIGGEFNAFTGKEYTAYYVKCAAEHRDVALDVLVDMLRNSRFDAEEIEREKGVIVEEMNMYFDTPRDFIGGVYEELLYGDQPLGWDIIGRKETVRGATRETFMSYLDRWYKPARMVLGVGGRIGDDAARARTGAARRPAGRRDRRAGAGRRRTRTGACSVFTKQSDQAHVDPRRAELSDRASRPLRAAGALDGARRRHVVAALHRGARAPRPRLLRLRAEPQLHRRRLALRAGGRRHQPDRRGGDDDPRASCGRSPPSRCPRDELEKARNFSKGRFVLQLESPQGLILFGLRREVLERRAPDLDEVLDGLNAVTAEDVQRVAQDLIADEQLRLARDRPVRRRRSGSSSCC